MADLIIPNDLAEQLQSLAEYEKRPLEETLRSMLRQYTPARETESQPTGNREDAKIRVRRKMYERARDYWRQVGDQQKLALSDEQLDEQFWLFDNEGVPRLKSEQESVTIPDNSLLRLGEALQQVSFRSGKRDVAERSREILQNDFADYLHRRMRGDVDGTK